MYSLKAKLNDTRRGSLLEPALPYEARSHITRATLGNMTPSKLSSLLAALDHGNITEAMIYFDEMQEKDLHLGAVIQTRFLAAVARNREIIAASPSKEDLFLADFMRDVYNNIPNLQASLISMLSAISHGFSMTEIVYGYSDNRLIVESLHPRAQSIFTFASTDKHQRLLSFPDYLDVRSNQTLSLPEDRFVFHKTVPGEYVIKAGLYRGISWMTLFYNYTLKDWMTFLDLYGIPLRLGKYKSTADHLSRETLKRAVRNLGTDAAAVISDDTTIEFIHSNITGSGELFVNAAEFFNRQKSKRILGQTLTTDQSNGSGSYALGRTHNQIREIIVDFDSKAIDETLNNQLIKPVIDLNFGKQKRYPKIETNLTTQSEVEIKLDRIKKMVELGVKIPSELLSEITGIQISKESPKYLSLKGENNDETS